MKTTKTFRRASGIALAFAALAFGHPSANAQTAKAPGMVWTNLNKVNQPTALGQRNLWEKEIAAAQKKWSADGDKTLVSAFTLSRSFKDVNPPVFASIFSAGFECERTGDSKGENLYVKCPMKIVTGSPANPRVKIVPEVCQLWIELEPGEVDGPRPDNNYTAMSLDKERRLQIRTVQYGKPVRECDLSVSVD
jgi:hypothetical protein